MSLQAHLLLGALTAAAIGFILYLVHQRTMKAKYALLWMSLGVVLAVVAVVPRLLDIIADRLGVAYPPAVWLMMGLVFLLLLAIHFSWEVSRLEDRVRRLAEELALLRHHLDERASADGFRERTVERPETEIGD